MGTPKDSARTRARIIEVAGELFAAYGYHGVTVRDIVEKAKTHQSALNYHFAGKEALYREVLLHACESPESAKLDMDVLRRMPAREALREVIRAWIRDYTEGDAGGWKARLVDRECLEPSPTFQELVSARIMPEIGVMTESLGRAANRPADSMPVQAAVLGLLGQVTTLCLYHRLLDAVAQGLYDEIHRDDRLSKALTHSALAFVEACDFSAESSDS